MTDEHAKNYERKMQAIYDQAANFKREFYPADPFQDGELMDAAYLDPKYLVKIYRAAKNLEAQGHQPFTNNLIISREKVNLTPLVRVNPLFVDRCRQQKIEVCELLSEFFWGTGKTFAEKRKEIMDMSDPQLLEYVQQVEESLEITPREMEVIVDVES